MGLIEKIKSRANLRTIYLRRKSEPVSAAEAPAAKPSTSTHDQKWEVHVTSNPKEYTLDHRSFNWLTYKMDDFLFSFNEDPVPTVSNEADNNDAPAKPTVDKYETGWGWLSHCWGSPYLANKTDDPTFESSYDDGGTVESSQPSASRVDQVLGLAAPESDVSDITTNPSIDDSDSDSENSSESEDEI